jgi:ABC-type glycerol-3-phosphate transport system permease component
MGSLLLRRRLQRRAFPTLSIVVFVFLLICGIVALFPFFLMLSTSFKPIKEVFLVSTHLLPRQPILSNYVKVFTESMILRYLLNGVIVTVFTLAGQLLVIIPASYAFAKLSFPGKRFLFVLILAALVFPRYIAAVPNFLLFSKLK